MGVSNADPSEAGEIETPRVWAQEDREGRGVRTHYLNV